MNKVLNKVKEKIGFSDYSAFFLMLWISLPFIMIICHTVMGIKGEFPTREEIEAAGLQFQYVTLYYNRETYQLLFHILGVISGLYVIYLGFNRKGIFKDRVLSQKKFLLSLGLLLAWAAISTIFSDNAGYAFIGEDYLCDGYSSYLIYAAVLIIAYSINNEEDKLKVMRYFIFMVTTLSILMLIQTLHVIDFLDYIFTTRAAIIFLQFNHYGYVLCMGVCCSFGLLLFDQTGKLKATILYALAFGINLVALLINDTFGAEVAVAIAIVIIFIMYCCSGKPQVIKPIWMVIAAVIMIVLAFTLSSGLRENVKTLVSDIGNIITNSEASASAGTGRFTLWKDTINRIKERPILGFGPEGFYGDNAITNNDSTHNEYLQIAGFLGIPGLLLYLSAIVMLLKHHFIELKKLSPAIIIATCAMIGYLISAFFGNPVFNTFPYYMMFFGLASSYELEQFVKKKKIKKK